MVLLDQSADSVFLAAVFADPINLESVAGGRIVIFVSDLLLQVIHFGREKLH